MYRYFLNKSRVLWDGNEYLCLSPQRSMVYFNDMDEDEKIKMSQKYHIYSISQEEAVYLSDPVIREKIIDLYEQNLNR